MTGKATQRFGSGLTTRRLLVALLFIAIFTMAVRQPADTDTWWHLKSGQLMWEEGRILRFDPFSHTMSGEPILYPALFQLLLWPIYRIVGLAGLALALAGLVMASFLLVYLQCEGRPFVAAFATLLGALASSIVWAMRPQIVSLLLAAVTAYVLARYKQGGNIRWLWPLPLLVVLWVNSHGGFVIAFLLMGCYLVGEALNRLSTPSPPASLPAGERGGQARLTPLAMIILACIPAALINPHTVKMIPYAFQTVTIGPLQDFIQEWAAPDFHKIQFQPFIWLLLLTGVFMGLSRRRADWTDLTLVCLFGYMAMLAARNIALFALITPPVLARHATAALDDLALAPRLSWLAVLTHTLPAPRPRRAQLLLNTLLLIVVAAAAAAKIAADLGRLRDPEVWGQGLPLEAAEYLRHHELPGEMFNTYNWGGYLIWELYPEKPVFIDGRTDLYALNSQVLDEYTKVHWVRPGWQGVLDAYGIGYVITEHTGLLDLTLGAPGGWEAVYRDDTAVIYVRAEETR